jgi:phosphoglycolate phosphatase-like HAD superfamily hydrolase
MVPMTSQGISGNLASWNDGPAATAIREFVARVATEGSPEFVPPDERVAVFDNDGTLWCEKPMPIELGFILKRLAAMAERDQSLRDRQPWKAAYGKDYHWLGDVITKHYHGDDSDVKVLLGGILQAFAGMSVDDYEAAAHSFLHEGRHPTLGHRFRDCGYRPMIDLLDYLAANGFTSYIASGGDRDFMRPVTEAIYGIPSERVIGSSNGDIPMLRFAGGPSRPGLGLLVLHDDPEREFDYVTGAERSLEEAETQGWTVVSIRNDWSTVFDG